MKMFGKKLKQEHGADWALVLEAGSNEFLKNRAINKLAQLFNLSFDEAKDLCENTPLILLDSLTQDVADRLRVHLSKSNVDCMATNDTFKKRKCFRAVWPEEPELASLLHEVQKVEEVRSPSKSDRVSAISKNTNGGSPAPSPKKDASFPGAGMFTPKGDASKAKRKLADTSKKADVKELMQLNAKIQEMDLTRARLEQELAVERQGQTNLSRQIQELEQALKASRGEVERLKVEGVDGSQVQSVSHLSSSRVEELESALRTEKQQFIQLQDECGRLERELMLSRDGSQSLMVQVKELEKRASERTNRETSFSTEARMREANLQTQLEQMRSEYDRAQHMMREIQSEADRFEADAAQAEAMIEATKKEVEQYKSQWLESQESISQSRTDADEVRSSLGFAQSKTAQLKQELDQVHRTLTEQMQAKDFELADWKRKANEWSASYSQMREEVERARAEKSSQQQALEVELQEWKRKSNDWSTRYAQVQKENEYLRLQQSEELESLRSRNQEVTSQLEQAQKQIRGFATQLEQQELIQKRMKAATELAEHESKLKLLVQSQQTLESDLHEKEESLKSALASQEVVEREIVKVKQVQKYLLEQSKLKEKSRFGRPRSFSQDMPTPRSEPDV